MCLLALKEIQKYWRINNNVLDLFLHYLDESVAKRLQGFHDNTVHGSVVGEPPKDTGAHHDPPSASAMTGADPFEDKYFGILSGQWESELAMNELGLLLDPQFQDHSWSS